ncbi:lysophospholipid acyltransferase family protein [Aestuariibius sp. 2305UL40-4]|uniref:lysophospholipid acyltransferase family protein n=1 Tax=Aestuariibius violaceus TaxID=3234132 RepID=UPI00345EF74E
MKMRIDPLIAERAPWLHRPGVLSTLFQRPLERALAYPATIALAEILRDRSSREIMDAMARRLARDVEVSGLQHIPRSGPAIIVANHPTGIADGIMLHHLITRVRNDAYFYANRDILRVLPQMEDMIAPVEWREEKRSAASARETMMFTRDAVNEGRLGVIFPSGRLAKRRGLQLHERPWMSSAARLAKKFDLPVIPIHVRARNSVLFYLFDLLHPTLRDITLFNETLNKDRQPFRLTVGEPVSPSAIPADPDAGIAMLRRAVLEMAVPNDSPFTHRRPLGRPAKRLT